MNIIEEKWDSVVDTLSTEFGFSPISINTWIKPLQVQRYDSDEGTLFIYVPIDEMGINEDFINSYINKKFTTPLRSTIAELTGLDCTKIVYTVEQNVVKEADSSSNTDNSFNNILEKANLNPEYTFENFVVEATTNLHTLHLWQLPNPRAKSTTPSSSTEVLDWGKPI